MQFVLAVLLFFTLPLWKQKHDDSHSNADLAAALPSCADEVKPLQIKGIKFTLVSFFFYCGIEATLGLWGSSFLVFVKEMPPAAAAQWIALFYAGITLGRLIAGFITMKMSNITMIRIGQITALTGSALLLLPLSGNFALMGFVMAGLGLAPIYPCMLHETPCRFGKEHSQKIMGYQMAAAYTGSAVLPPLLGMIAVYLTIAILPLFVLTYIIIMLVCSEKVNEFTKYPTAVVWLGKK
jgi:fucose permease